MYTNENLLDEFKNAWNKPNNAIAQIIIINTIVFLVMLTLSIFLKLSGEAEIYRTIEELLMLPSDLSLFLSQPWSIITYFFLHADLFHILFNMLVIYWFGKLVVEYLGNDKVTSLYVLGGVAGGLLYLFMYNTLPFYESKQISRMLGASAGVYAVITAAATLLPNYTFHLLLIGPVKIKYIALFYIVLSFSQTVGANAGGEWAHLAGAAMGYIYIKQIQKGQDLGLWIHQIIGFLRSFSKKSSKIKVTHRSKPKKKTKAATKTNPTTSPLNNPNPEQDEIDTILDKISQKGYESLTKEEKQKLFNASKK
jgi:membrane associated rhomboid family serine protease